MVKSYTDLIVWQKSIVLVEQVYRLTARFPKEEVYGIISQMRRSAVSIPSNIAEGSVRGTRKDYRHFLFNAFGSGAELETQVEIVLRLQYAEREQVESLIGLLGEVMRMLNAMIQKLGEVDIQKLEPSP